MKHVDTCANSVCTRIFHFVHFYVLQIADLQIISSTLIVPHNTTVLVGSSATFVCIAISSSENPGLRWKYRGYTTTASDFIEVCFEHTPDGIKPPKCNVTFNDNSRITLLTINNVQLNDSGLYKCSETSSRVPSEARLSVFGMYVLFIYGLCIMHSSALQLHYNYVYVCAIG